MGRNNIWQDGIKTRFSTTNQPPGRGRPKGRRNRATRLREALAMLQYVEDLYNRQRQAQRNARRRERYQQRKARPVDLNQ